MSLQFIIGPASRDHFKTTIQQLRTQFAKRPNDQFFYLIPNHIKFDAEVKTLKQLNQTHADAYAQTNVQILSLTRLAWFLFGQDPEYQVPRLSDAGINMLLYQILLDHQAELTVFRGEESHPGFISQLASQINELQVGQITPADLKATLAAQPDMNANLRAKLTDLSLIYEAFEERTAGKYLHRADLLKVLTEKLAEADLSGMHFIIGGYSNMSAQELQIMTVLLKKAATVTVDLKMMPAPQKDQADAPNLFDQPQRLYRQLAQIAKQNGVLIVKDDLWAAPQRVNADLQSLEKYWMRSVQMSTDPIAQPLQKSDTIQVIKADNPYSEVAKVALMIRQMVASGHYRYRDFIVMTRHLDAFQNMVRPVFQMQEIPYFEDVQKTMDTHPLVELINALFMIQPVNSRRSYRYQDVMRLLKTELLLPQNEDGSYENLNQYRQDLALAENLVLRNGFEGKKWTEKADWVSMRINATDFNMQAKVDPVITEQVNRIHHFVRKLLPPFFRKMKQAPNGTAAVTVLYQFLVKNGVVDQLKQWRDHAQEQNNLNEASRPEQVWQTFCGLLDDYVDILGAAPFQLDHFLAVLQAGFEGANYSQIPSTLDQVTITESGIVQTSDYKVVFMIGSTNENMPDQVTNESLLSDSDRDDLQPTFRDDQFLTDNSETQMANSSFLNYQAFMTGTEKLIFTYSINDDYNQESGVKRSPYIDRIMNHFQISEQTFHAVPGLDSNDQAVEQYVGTYRMTLRYLVQASYQSKQLNEPLSDQWQALYHKLIHTNDYYQHLTNKLLGGLDYQNRPTTLKPEIVTDLYTDVLNSSISQLEDFYKNPYEYFLTYGLSLKPREEFELSSGNKGQFFHSVLEQMVSQLNVQHLDIATVDEKTLLNLVGRIANEMIKSDPRYQIMTSSYQMKYVSRLLIKTVKRMALTMHWQSQYTTMRPRQTEISFGQSGKATNLAPLLFDVDEQHKLRVRGRIDRIDSLMTNDRNFLAIVDYKSGNKEIKYDELYSGISIQLMTYLDVIKKNLSHFSEQQKAALAGALYLHVQDPILAPDKVKGGQFETAMLKAQKYNGILVDDPELLSMMKEQDLAKNKNSLIYSGIRMNKDQEVTSSENMVTNEQLTQLLDYTEMLIQQAGQAIFNGNIDLAPIKTDHFDAMQYTDYAPIMQFDPLLTENNYRQFDKMKLKELLDKITRGEHPKWTSQNNS